MSKKDYEDHPEEHWRAKEERDLSDAKERLERWEKQNPDEDHPEEHWRAKEERDLSDAKERLERWEKQNPEWPYGFKPKD